MHLILTALLILVISGLLTICSTIRIFKNIALAGNLISVVMILIPLFSSLWFAKTHFFSIPWSIPFGEFSLTLTPLSAWFLLSVLLVFLFAGAFGHSYMKHHYSSEHSFHWVWFTLLEAAMILVLLADNIMLFLIAWEVMSISSFFLVMSYHKIDEVREAGKIYLIASHIGTFFIIISFSVLTFLTSSFSFSHSTFSGSPFLVGLVLVSGLIGFGMKAGIVPLHIWLPEAHPAAPSHVSAVMSGVMVNMGIYGILKLFILSSFTLEWFGITLIVIGLISGIFGIVNASAHGNLKKMLAYSTTENMGIVLLGFGIGIIGLYSKLEFVAVLGFLGAMLHILNHSFFKSLLFLSAGSYLYMNDTADVSLLGGSATDKKNSIHSATSLFGIFSICGIPPFSGFFSEFLIYLSSLYMIFYGGHLEIIIGIVVLIVLIIIGGAAVVAFLGTFGLSIFGLARGNKSENNLSVLMNLSLIFLTIPVCLTLFFYKPILFLLGNVYTSLFKVNLIVFQAQIVKIDNILYHMVMVILTMLIIVSMLLTFRYLLLQKRDVSHSPTWDCGYHRLNTKMQYSSFSFTSAITTFFACFLERTFFVKFSRLKIFPENGEFSVKLKDIVYFYVVGSVTNFINLVAGWVRLLQTGRVQNYVLYVTIFLIFLLLWKLW